MVEDDSEWEDELSGAGGAGFVLSVLLVINATLIVVYANASNAAADGAYRTYMLAVYLGLGGLVLSVFLGKVTKEQARSPTFWRVSWLLLLLGGVLSVYCTWNLAVDASRFGQGFLETNYLPSEATDELTHYINEIEAEEDLEAGRISRPEFEEEVAKQRGLAKIVRRRNEGSGENVGKLLDSRPRFPVMYLLLGQLSVGLALFGAMWLSKRKMVEDDSESEDELSGAGLASFVLGGVGLANVGVIAFYAHSSAVDSARVYWQLAYVFPAAIVVYWVLCFVLQMFKPFVALAWLFLVVGGVYSVHCTRELAILMASDGEGTQREEKPVSLDELKKEDVLPEQKKFDVAAKQEKGEGTQREEKPVYRDELEEYIVLHNLRGKKEDVLPEQEKFDVSSQTPAEIVVEEPPQQVPPFTFWEWAFGERNAEWERRNDEYLKIQGQKERAKKRAKTERMRIIEAREREASLKIKREKEKAEAAAKAAAIRKEENRRLRQRSYWKNLLLAQLALGLAVFGATSISRRKR